MLLEGLHVPLTTPFFADGRLNLRKLEANVAHYSLTPASGLVALGETGEAALLSDDEIVEVLRAVTRAADSTKVLLAEILRYSVTGTLDLIDRAAEMGFDVAVIRPPALAGVSTKERMLYLEVVADRAALPVLLAGSLPVELAVALARHPKVLGWAHDFESSADLAEVLAATGTTKRSVEVTAVFAAVTGRMVREAAGGLVSAASLVAGGVSAPPSRLGKTRTKTVGFQLLATRTVRLLECLNAGAVGAMLPFAAAAPQACYEVMAAWKDGDAALAAEKQGRLMPVARWIEGEGKVAALKYACDLNGYAGGPTRLPLLPLTGAERIEVAELVAGLPA